MVEGSLEAYGQALLNEIKKVEKNSKLGVWGRISIFGHYGPITVPKYENCSNFSLDEDRKVVEGSLEAYGQALLNEIKKIEKKSKLGGLGPNFHIWALRSQNTKIVLVSVWMKIGKSLRAR